VDRHTRKDLKTDKFAVEVGHTFEYISEHRSQAKRYGLIALVVILIGAGVYFYMRRQVDIRAEELAAALKIDDATVGTNVQPTNLNFPTLEEKVKARNAAMAAIAAKYPGTAEGSYAEIYLAADFADKGNLAEAEKKFRKVMDTGPANYAALARLSVAETLVTQGKPDEAKKVLQEAVAKPATTVSKEQATILLAQLVSKSDPCEARRLLEPLRADRSAISRAAVQALGETAPCPGK
jgi:predicted negative regulator of RcsB-dependent stress response